MSDDLFQLNRPFNQLDGFYTEWSEHLTKNCIRTLRHFPTNDTNDTVLGDIRSYYDTLNHYATKDTILYFLFPSWRSNSLETPILFLGDIHPRLFTNLIQSFMDDDGLNQDPILTFSNLAAWEELSSELENTINETVSRLLGEMKEAQDGFIRRFSSKFVSSFLGSWSGTVVMDTATLVTTTDQDDGAMIMEELVRIFREANKLRKDTITSIVGVLNMNQIALFLESVCKFLAGFKHQDHAFQNSLIDYHLINQQLPKHEHLVNILDPSGVINAQAHHNYPPPMMQQRPPSCPPHIDQLFQPFAPSRLVPNYPPPRMMPPYAPLLLPVGHQRFPPFAPSGLVIAHQTYHPPMMHQYPPQQQKPEQGHVIYVGNLAPAATQELLSERFSCYHSARVTKICVGKGGGHKYGFVSFADEREKCDAMEAMNGQMFLGWEMHIGPAAKNSI
ncbi:unnamed protein product [Eruca vesicaria subsp. sativa]|uniref:RRM domain-containing protein n=1 Tax=Eruca vesicaria subsp. sativa TaxID=29727 RepID=A0ABC8KUI3_ERUVS|nr:unnamed protein product [Eruca vesicaria subsp. sativa]